MEEIMSVATIIKGQTVLMEPPESEHILHPLHGPEVLDWLANEALEDSPHGFYRADSERELTQAEAEALRSGGFSLESEDFGEDDPIVRTAAEYAALLGGALTIVAAAARLRVESSVIRQWLSARPPKLYGIHLASGWRIPGFQFEDDGLLPGLEKVVAALNPELHPVAVYRWFTTPNTDLEDRDERRVSPREWLSLGYNPSTVADVALDLLVA